jgi:DNA-binding NarL/FixJ family response regulator
VRSSVVGLFVNTLETPLLTSRENEVLSRVARGLRDKEIAREMYLSVRTVNCYVARIRTKLGVKTRASAVEVARSHGLIITS